MKKSILFGLFALLASTVAFAEAPQTIVIGEAKFKDELVIVKGNIACTANAFPLGQINAEHIIHAQYQAVVVQEETFNVEGKLDNTRFSIGGNVKYGYVHLSLQDSGSQDQSAAMSSSSSGNFTADRKVVSLTLTGKGKT